MEEVAKLSRIFDNKHSRFTIEQSGSQLNCFFKAGKKTSYEFKVTLPKSANASPIWTYTKRNDEISKLLRSLKGMSLTDQVKTVVQTLCHKHRVPIPKELFQLVPDFEPEFASEFMRELERERLEEVEALEQLKMLKIASTLAFSGNSPGTSGNVVSVSRLKKELVQIWKSESVKNGVFEVKLVTDSVYEWNVRLLLPAFVKETSLYQDLLEIKMDQGSEGVLLHFIFKDTYPQEPPFIRVVSPVIHDGFLFEGFVCMELLMKQRWIPAYSLEHVILEVAASITRGKGRVVFGATDKEYSLKRAQRFHDNLTRMPDAFRWTSTEEQG